MTITVKAVYEDGVLKPKSPLELAEHTEVELLVIRPLACDPGDPALDPDDPTGWKAIDRLIGCIGGGERDVAENHDKYLYDDPHD